MRGPGHVVIGAKPEPDRPVDLGVPGGQHDHQHIRPLAQAPAQFGASWPREHEASSTGLPPLRSNAASASGELQPPATGAFCQ